MQEKEPLPNVPMKTIEEFVRESEIELRQSEIELRQSEIELEAVLNLKAYLENTYGKIE